MYDVLFTLIIAVSQLLQTASKADNLYNMLIKIGTKYFEILIYLIKC